MANSRGRYPRLFDFRSFYVNLLLIYFRIRLFSQFGCVSNSFQFCLYFMQRFEIETREVKKGAQREYDTSQFM